MTCRLWVQREQRCCWQGIDSVAGMVLFVFLERLNFFGEMTDLGFIALSTGSLDFRLILLDVLVD